MATRAPPCMDFSVKGDKTEKYNLWKQRLELFSQITGKAGADLVPHILDGLDDEGLKIFNSFNLTPDQRRIPENIFTRFEARLKITKPNFRAARLDLHFFLSKSG